jgi:hypothetical protein
MLDTVNEGRRFMWDDIPSIMGGKAAFREAVSVSNHARSSELTPSSDL